MNEDTTSPAPTMVEPVQVQPASVQQTQAQHVPVVISSAPAQSDPNALIAALQERMIQAEARAVFAEHRQHYPDLADQDVQEDILEKFRKAGHQEFPKWFEEQRSAPKGLFKLLRPSVQEGQQTPAPTAPAHVTKPAPTTAIAGTVVPPTQGQYTEDQIRDIAQDPARWAMERERIRAQLGLAPPIVKGLGKK